MQGSKAVPELPGYLIHGKIGLQQAPIAQWIERYPPEVEARVRVAVGVLECVII